MGNKSFGFCQRVSNIIDSYKTRVGTTLTMTEMESNPSNGDIKAWMVSLARHHMKGVDDMACMMTEMYEEMDKLNLEIEGKDSLVSATAESTGANSTC